MEREYKNTMVALGRFCLPLIGSGVLQQLYAWADAFIVGNVEGEIALAAVGSNTSLVNFFTTLITGFTLGLSILFAQRFGEGRKSEIKSILSSFVFVLAAIFAAVAVFATINARAMLEAMNTTSDAIDLATVYLSIVLLGLPFLAVYNVFAAALRGIGDSRTPFLAVLVSALTNVVLDIIFVAFFSWGVAGAAWATLISQVAMTIFVVIYAFAKKPILRFGCSVRKEALGTGCYFGFPPMIQTSLTALGSLILQDFMNGFGTDTVVAITTAYRIDTLVLLPIVNLGSGISTMTAQKKGEGDAAGIGMVLRSGLLLVAITAILLSSIVIPIGGRIIALFGAGDAAVAIGSAFFLRIASFYVIFGLSMGLRGYLEGQGDLIAASIIGILSLVVRIGLSYLWRDLFGNMVIAWAEIVAWFAMLALYIARSTMVNRKRMGSA